MSFPFSLSLSILHLDDILFDVVTWEKDFKNAKRREEEQNIIFVSEKKLMCRTKEGWCVIIYQNDEKRSYKKAIWRKTESAALSGFLEEVGDGRRYFETSNEKKKINNLLKKATRRPKELNEQKAVHKTSGFQDIFLVGLFFRSFSWIMKIEEGVSCEKMSRSTR